MTNVRLKTKKAWPAGPQALEKEVHTKEKKANLAFVADFRWSYVTSATSSLRKSLDYKIPYESSPSMSI